MDATVEAEEGGKPTLELKARGLQPLVPLGRSIAWPPPGVVS